MKNKKVNILLSSYNGECFIRDQIDSLITQKYDNIEIYIRDDGSKDRTCQILKEYENSPKSLINIIKGENLGFINSFFSLLKCCDEADYYAFCDQDDVWNPDKISRAVEIMSMTDGTEPVLYFSAYDYVDENLNYRSRSKTPNNLSFANCLVDCAPLGFTCVMNNAARNEIIEKLPVHSCGHDWWTYMVCTGIGKVLYDDTVTVRYRRYDSNVSSGGAGFLRFQIWRFRKFFLGDYFSNITEMLKEYEYLFGDRLSEENKKILAMFTDKNFKNAMKKVFYSHPFRQGVLDEVFLRLCFLMGKL